MRREELAELVAPLLEEEGYELVECSVSRAVHTQVFRVSMDKPGGVSIDACERISRRLADLLDANPILRGAYHMEVSSAGMNRPIWTREHFERFRGEEAQIEVAGDDGTNRLVRGAIGPLEGDRLVLHLDRGQEEVLAFGAVIRARLRMDPWKPRSASRKGEVPPAPGSPAGPTAEPAAEPAARPAGQPEERKDENHGHG